MHALRWSRRASRSAAAMAAAFDFVEGSVHEFDLLDQDKVFQRMEAASVMIRELQDLRSPHRDATPPTDATTIIKHLVAAAVAQTRLRHDACASVLDNLRYCKQNGLTYDPLRSYTKGDATPGPDSRKKHLVQVRFESWSTFWIQDRRPSSLLWSSASSALMVSCSVSWTTMRVKHPYIYRII